MALTANARENAAKQGCVRATNAIGHHPQRRGFSRRTEFVRGTGIRALGFRGSVSRCPKPARENASIYLFLLLIPSGAETLVFWATQRLAWLVGPKDVQLMTRRDDLELSHGATAKARENTVKQDREQATNAIGIARKGPGFCAGRNL